MNIIKKAFKFTSSLKKRSKTEECILHHRAGNGDVESIHKLHLKNGWAGIGYHLYIRKDGSIYEGRPLDRVGAHATNHNSKAVGICFEGNFEIDIMPEVQKQAGIEACNYIRSIYPNIKFLRHKDVGKTACPGKNFPFSEIVNGKVQNVPQATKPSNEAKYKVGDKVKVSSYYASSIDDVSKAVHKVAIGTITKVLTNGAVNRYLLDNGNIGWCNEGDIREVISDSYYPKCASRFISLVSALNSIGVDSSYSYRKKIALKNNIKDYKGSFSQNISLLTKLKAGRLKKV